MRDYNVGINEIEEMSVGPEKAIQWLVCALSWQGEHHKQWFIERALCALNVDVNEVRKWGQDHDWFGLEPGIAP